MTTGQAIARAIVVAALGVALAIGAAIGFCSCKVTRTTTCESSYVEKGDSSVIITSKTIETYDASKNNSKSQQLLNSSNLWQNN